MSKPTSCACVAISTALATRLSTSSPGRGFTWIVASRNTSERQACEASATGSAEPAVRHPRKVMIAMTTTRARPATKSRGMSGALVLNDGSGSMARTGSTKGSFITAIRRSRQFAVADHQPSREAELVHKLEIMRRNDNRRAKPVESTNNLRRRRARPGSTLPVGSSASNNSGRTIQRSGDRRSLFFPAGKDRRDRVHPIAETDPAQKLDHFSPIAKFLPSHRP